MAMIGKIVRRLLQEQQEQQGQQVQQEQQKPLEQQVIKQHQKAEPVKDVQALLTHEQMQRMLQEISQKMENGKYKALKGELVECQDMLEHYSACNCRIQKDLNNVRHILDELRERIMQLTRV